MRRCWCINRRSSLRGEPTTVGGNEFHDYTKGKHGSINHLERILEDLLIGIRAIVHKSEERANDVSVDLALEKTNVVVTHCYISLLLRAKSFFSPSIFSKGFGLTLFSSRIIMSARCKDIQYSSKTISNMFLLDIE